MDAGKGGLKGRFQSPSYLFNTVMTHTFADRVLGSVLIKPTIPCSA